MSAKWHESQGGSGHASQPAVGQDGHRFHCLLQWMRRLLVSCLKALVDEQRGSQDD